MACRTSVPRHQGLNRLLREQSPKHWRTRELPLHSKSVVRHPSQTHPSSLRGWAPQPRVPSHRPLTLSPVSPLLGATCTHAPVCSFPGASGLRALLHLFPGHKIQRPDSWAAAQRVRERGKHLFSFLTALPLNAPSCSVLHYFLSLPHILIIRNPPSP